MPSKSKEHSNVVLSTSSDFYIVDSLVSKLNMHVLINWKNSFYLAKEIILNVDNDREYTES